MLLRVGRLIYKISLTIHGMHYFHQWNATYTTVEPTKCKLSQITGLALMLVTNLADED